MADIVDKKTRSRMMAGIRGKNTKPELEVRRYLHRSGLRYRLHDRNLPGKPDLVFPKFKTVVEVRGCFWHRHEGCSKAYIPKSNQKFWIEKFEGNVERDNRNDRKLEGLGWRVIVIWECEVSETSLRSLCKRLKSGVKEYGS